MPKFSAYVLLPFFFFFKEDFQREASVLNCIIVFYGENFTTNPIEASLSNVIYRSQKHFLMKNSMPRLCTCLEASARLGSGMPTEQRASQRGRGEGSYWWTLLAPEVKNTDHARHKEKQMVLLEVSFPLQDLPLCSFTSYQTVPEIMQQLVLLPLLLDSYQKLLKTCMCKLPNFFCQRVNMAPPQRNMWDTGHMPFVQQTRQKPGT